MKEFTKRFVSAMLAVITLLCLALPAFAAETGKQVVDSVVAKNAPEIVIQEVDDEQGNRVGLIAALKQDDKIIHRVLTSGDGVLRIISYADRDSESVSVKTKLENAYRQITETKTLAELNPGLDEIAKKIDPRYDATVLLVSDLFEITFDEGDWDEKLQAEDDCSIIFRLKTSLKDGDPIPTVIYQNEANGAWDIVDEDKVKYIEDGILEVETVHLCAVALVRVSTEKAEALINSQQGEEPEQEKCAPVWLIILLALILLAIIILIILFSRKKPAKEQ